MHQAQTGLRTVMVVLVLITGAIFAAAAWMLLKFIQPRYLAWIGLIGLFDLAGALGGLLLARRVSSQMRDPATGLYNRNFLEGELPRELERARRYRRHLAILTLSAADSRTGSQPGDLTLRSLSGVLLACTRASDTPVRSGPGEFTLLLPETDPTGAITLARRIHDLIDRRAQAGTLPVAVHLGIANFPTFTEPAALLQAAGRAAQQARAKQTPLEVALVTVATVNAQ